MTMTAVLPEFPVGSVFTHAEMVEAFKVGYGGGIRYRGTAQKPDLVVVVTSQPGAYVDRPDRRRPYDDEKSTALIRYTGTGKIGNQELVGGNLAMYMQPVWHYPIYVVEQFAPDHYQYLGQYQVDGVARDRQADENGQLRSVYVFQLVPIDQAP